MHWVDPLHAPKKPEYLPFIIRVPLRASQIRTFERFAQAALLDPKASLRGGAFRNPRKIPIKPDQTKRAKCWLAVIYYLQAVALDIRDVGLDRPTALVFLDKAFKRSLDPNLKIAALFQEAFILQKAGALSSARSVYDRANTLLSKQSKEN